MSKTKNYQLKGNPVQIFSGIPIIGNLIYDELGKEVLSKHNERFKDINRIEDNHKYEDGEPISFLNVPRVLSYDQILREIAPNMHILNPEGVVEHWDVLPERDSTYADTNSIVVFPNEGPNEYLRKEVLDILGKSTKIKIPLMVSGLGVEKANNDHGFRFTKTDYTKSKTAHFLKENGEVSYNKKKGLVSSEEGVSVWTPSDQSGLRRLYRNWSDGLDAGNDDLLYSSRSGRVQIFQDPQGCDENLEELTQNLQQEREAQIEKLNKRYENARKVLTGELKL